METLFNFLLGLHIAGGAAGLISGTINMIRKKGDIRHKKTGKIFFRTMLLAGLTALVLASIHPNQFLFTIGIFTLYMLGSGYRYLYLRAQQPQANWIDWSLSIFMIVFGLLFFAQGVQNLLHNNYFGIALFVFGGIGLSMSMNDIRFYRGKVRSKNFWLRGHIARMCGTYIASLTAFLVVNIHFLPALLIWLLPTVIITPLIVKWSRKYEKA
ncbi:hypothetical protein IFO69_07365 [Echinicola sp. CAU 1574]|uniref:DUF2306 domain-containing protein n=1 Tax=Echinicola arenosa TaxID=2774144 RepID=A0ABR9AJR6_9BACT|nr:hypothetical protein [Echinicola arenosa]MBD8488556.1 hypothetical protein [Echinicola arenosa]